MLKFAVLLALAAVVAVEADVSHILNQHSHYAPITIKKYEHHQEEEHYDHHPAYKFHYKVEDKKHHDFHGQEEHRDGHNVEGKYWLVEPDGHLRTVKYRADKKNGFIAEVHREYLHHH